MAAIAPDLPGFGGGADLPGPYTMEAYADWLAASLSARGMERIVLVGGSMGGVGGGGGGGLGPLFFLPPPPRPRRAPAAGGDRRRHGRSARRPGQG
jgi:hypothetical protein